MPHASLPTPDNYPPGILSGPRWPRLSKGSRTHTSTQRPPGIAFIYSGGKFFQICKAKEWLWSKSA